MIHSKGKPLLRLATLAALLVALGILPVLVAHADPGSIIIEKQTVPPGGTGFEFTDDIPGGPALFYLDDDQRQKFLQVPDGVWTVTETEPRDTPGGYKLTNVVCRDINNPDWHSYQVASLTVTIDLSDNIVECIFTNEPFPPPPPPVVGGYVIPVNKLELLAPWMAIVGLAALAALTIALARRRRRA